MKPSDHSPLAMSKSLNPAESWSPVQARLALLLLCLAWSRFEASGLADEAAALKKTPLGQFVTVTSPIDDMVFARVSNAAIKLQNLAVQEGRAAFLILQLEPGTSQFHHVQGLAKFLTSPQIANVTTVAWVPENVTGPNVVVALACRQIVMSPNAELGDIGRGKPLDKEEQDVIVALAQKRHNPRVNPAIARGMMDQQEQLWRVRVRSKEAGKDELETSVVTKNELKTLQNTNVNIDNADLVKEAGVLGTFRGSTSRDLDILVLQTADSRAEVAELFGLPRESMREESADKELRRVRLVRVEGFIDRLQESFLDRQIERAVSEHAQVIVFQIDSPHGHTMMPSISLAHTIADLQEQKIRTIAYIPVEATQGAAIVALACDEIILHPDARLGGAEPVDRGPPRPRDRDHENMVRPLAETLAGLATKKHRPAALCAAIVDRKLKVFQVTNRDNGRMWFMSESEIQNSNGEWITGPQLPETNGEQLFAVNGDRAYELKLAEPPVHDFSELKSRIGLPVAFDLRPIERTWVDDLVFTLNRPAMTILLVVLGVVFIYLELHFMTGLLGILSVLCFALFFWSKFLGGTAGWLEVVLFVLGLSCLGMEIFVVPGFGVFGVSGILLVLASLVLAGHTWTFDLQTNVEELTWLTGQILVSLAIVGALGIGGARYLPRLPFFESMILGPPGNADAEPQLRDPLNRNDSLESDGITVGSRGVSITMLRPSGKAKLDDHIVDVISDGPFIAPEMEIEVISVSGNRIFVRQA